MEQATLFPTAEAHAKATALRRVDRLVRARSTPYRVLVACEYSGVVREAFNALSGFHATSCDLLPCEDGRDDYHHQGDVRDILGNGWDLMICHPDCTYLTVSAEWAYKDPDFERYPGVGYHQRVKPGTLVGAKRREAREEALDFVRALLDAPIPHIALENPVGRISSAIRPADQYVQPHEYGHDASKKTGLWLKNLPPLTPTKLVEPRYVDGKPRWGNQTDGGQNRLSPADDRWKERARTYAGIAAAMAEQWGAWVAR